jgi:hypothetical protein
VSDQSQAIRLQILCASWAPGIQRCDICQPIRLGDLPAYIAQTPRAFSARTNRRTKHCCSHPQAATLLHRIPLVSVERIEAALDANNKVIGWRHCSTAPSIQSTFQAGVTHEAPFERPKDADHWPMRFDAHPAAPLGQSIPRREDRRLLRGLGRYATAHIAAW